MILVGVTHDDEQADIDYLVNKTVNLRIFSAVDGTSGFDLSLMDVGRLGPADQSIYSVRGYSQRTTTRFHRVGAGRRCESDFR